MVGECDANVAESAVDDVEIVAHVESNHRAVVQTERKRASLELETEAEGSYWAEKEAVVAAVTVVETDTATKSTPKLPCGKTGCPIGPLLDVPVVDYLSGKSLVKVEHAGRDVEEILFAEMILVFEVDGGTSEMCTDGVRRFLCLCHTECA